MYSAIIDFQIIFLSIIQRDFGLILADVTEKLQRACEKVGSSTIFLKSIFKRRRGAFALWVSLFWVGFAVWGLGCLQVEALKGAKRVEKGKSSSSNINPGKKLGFKTRLQPYHNLSP